MTVFDEMKPRTGKASANKRERELARQLAKLIEIGDEETLQTALEKDFGITEEDPRYKEILKIWRGAV